MVISQIQAIERQRGNKQCACRFSIFKALWSRGDKDLVQGNCWHDKKPNKRYLKWPNFSCSTNIMSSTVYLNCSWRFPELKFKNYKYIVNVILGENKGAGVKIGTRCIWDAEADSYAHSNFKNVRIMLINAQIDKYH